MRLFEVAARPDLDARVLRAEAEKLNRQLYDASSGIDVTLMAQVKSEINAVCDAMGYDCEYRANWHRHRDRLVASIIALRALLEDGDSVLEQGEISVATFLLRTHFPAVRWKPTPWDLRSPWPCASESFDAVVSMEVIEHLSDPPRGFNEHLDFSGLDTCLAESYRVLRRGRRLFLTTPNAASVVCLANILFGNAALFYPPHIREYARHELTSALERAGFVIESLHTVHCLALDVRTDYTPLFEMLLAGGHSTRDRGDDWFVVARKV